MMWLTRSSTIDFEFFWLGRVPCRTVQVVGILVGVDEYDSKVRLRGVYQKFYFFAISTKFYGSQLTTERVQLIATAFALYRRLLPNHLALAAPKKPSPKPSRYRLNFPKPCPNSRSFASA